MLPNLLRHTFFLHKEEAKWYLKTVQGFPESEELSHIYAFKWSFIVEWLALMIKGDIPNAGLFFRNA